MKKMVRFAALLVLSGAVTAAAQEPEATVVADGLNNPCGIAVQPNTGIVFVADSGARRVVRIRDGEVEEVIVDFPQDVYGTGPMYDIGPLGLLFLSENTLVVGGGGLPDGEELLRVYDLGSQTLPLVASQMTTSFRLPEDGDTKGEGNFYALTRAGDAIFATANGDDTKGWVARAVVRGNEVVSFERFLATKEATDVDAPVGIATTAGGSLAVGQMGEITIPGDSLLTFYSTDGKMRMNLETGLHDICALAFSPGDDSQLYALDFAWFDTSQGGLFRLQAVDDNGTQGVEAIKVMSLDKPTAMAFGADGALYVTVVGTMEEGSEEPAGQLLRIMVD